MRENLFIGVFKTKELFALLFSHLNPPVSRDTIIDNFGVILNLIKQGFNSISLFHIFAPLFQHMAF